jgi:hypothetical protein
MAADFAAFLARLGHRVVTTESGAWYDASRFLLGIPTHELRRRQRARCAALEWADLGARFTTPLAHLEDELPDRLVTMPTMASKAERQHVQVRAD